MSMMSTYQNYGNISANVLGGLWHKVASIDRNIDDVRVCHM
jgi:hypothetical protein